VLRMFYGPSKYIALAGFVPATFGSSGKHTNYYITKVTHRKAVSLGNLSETLHSNLPRPHHSPSLPPYRRQTLPLSGSTWSLTSSNTENIAFNKQSGPRSKVGHNCSTPIIPTVVNYEQLQQIAFSVKHT
jgi:hypothetical protein